MANIQGRGNANLPKVRLVANNARKGHNISVDMIKHQAITSMAAMYVYCIILLATLT